MIYLILLAGDVELIPGPASIESGSISNDLLDSSMVDLSIFEQIFSIAHYSILCFDLILYVPSTIFQLYRDGSSWVEPVLS